MMIAAASTAATEDKGFNFDYMNNDRDINSMDMNNIKFDEGDLYVDDDFGGDLVMDADYFFTILDEDVSQFHPPLPDLPINTFHPSAENAQEMVSAAPLGNVEGSCYHPGYGAGSVNSVEMVQLPHSSPQGVFLNDANEASFARSNVECGSNQSSNIIKTESTEDWLSICKMSAGVTTHSSLDSMNQGLISANAVMPNSVKGESGDCHTSHAWLDKNTALSAQDGASFTEVPMYNFFDSKRPESILYDSHSVEQFDTINTFESSSSTITDEASAEPYYWGRVDRDCDKQAFERKDELNNGQYLLNGFQGNSCTENKDDAFRGLSIVSSTGQLQPSVQSHFSGAIAGRPAFYSHNPAIDIKPTILSPLEDPLSSENLCNTLGASPYKMEGGAVAQPGIIESDPFSSSHDACQVSLSADRSEDGADDDDVCVIEDMSAPAQLQLSSHQSSNSQISAFSSGCAPMAKHFASMSGIRPKALDERLIFQAVVQDLSQPKLEATPPDGVLTVPLLRHQRIALSWMVQKEKTSWPCSGGILADDQGLGKTVSTIALILTERAPSATTSKTMEQGELETLDLDEEEEKQAGNIVSMSGIETSFLRGRPSAGTLIVCPTSVLRQWASELQNKVTREVDLSVYVYHGSNRTKDPYELAKYDVVLTTYSIVSMEVPKQPVVVKGCSDKQKPSADGTAASSSRKRKRSDKKCSKRDMHNELLESVTRPLGKVSWFRVVLDEAQSIKNHRTQVAQACWGLRAKRRWCLSGTPIQNAVDDLYSYFRFLRYDPYCGYNSFCSKVKIPITRHPASGYKKLQAVLKTVMLRRTKGTLLDGEPIINLPPKSVLLKKVDFSEEERDFYTRLEADSRAQFQVYAEQGTVKQNYVNILLMLLRLRQACDHPLLVKGYDSSSVLKSTMHAAKKLSQEQQISLLNCLEASLALCGICSDPPEDAVVSLCCHVFCNQCISERLTGDDNQCPEKTCKAQLSASSVFSKGTLKSCLFDGVCEEESHIISASESSDHGELVERQPAALFASAKIKAALEVLQSLSKPHTTGADNVSMDSVILNAGLVSDCNSAFCAPNNGSSKVKEKALVFSQWTSMLDLLEDCLKESSIQYRRLDGTMSVVARDKAVNDFNTHPEVSVMIMSLKAASLGLNMVAACHVLLLDLWWNPTTEDQAIDRAHRIGQTRPVTVVRLTVKDTVEDRILALQQKKRELVASAFGEDETGRRQARLTVEDLKYLFMA